MNPDATEPRVGLPFRPDIEGLRGVAVLLVVGCHCGISWLPGGFVGVDVFVVLSGYLISGLLVAEHRATSRVDLPEFYARRARRLVPACALVLVATAVMAATVLSPQELAYTGSAGRAAALYLSNVFFDRSASDYFAPSVEANPLLHTWSLGVEEQFYLVWPSLFLLAGRGPRGSRRLLFTLIALSALSFTFCIYATRLAPTVAFYELPARAWEFAVGGLLALLPATPAAADPRRAIIAGVLGIATIVGAGVWIEGGAGFPGWIALVPAAGTIATLYAGSRAPGRGISLALSNGLMQFLGSRSYSWYLWHWPFIVFARAVVPAIGVGGKVVVALASLLAATLTCRFVEQPFRHSAHLRARPGLSLRLAAGAILLTVGTSWVLLLHGRQLALDSRLESISAATGDVADLSQSDCMTQGLSTDVRTCAFGAPGAVHTLILFGDSHAIQWFNPLRTATRNEAWGLTTVLKPGCPAGDFNPHPASAASEACTAWRVSAIEQIRAIHPSAVLLADYTGEILRGFGTEKPMPADELRSGLRRTLASLASLGAPIIVLRDTPLPPFDVAACVARNLAHQLSAPATCAFAASAALNGSAFAAQQAAAAGLRNIYFLDLSDLFCPGPSCPAMQHGLLVYRDDNHLTGRFSESLAPSVQMRLFALLRSAQ